MVSEINGSEFEDKIKGKCLVDFFATWCPPCKMLAPILDKVSEQVEGVNFYKINIDESPEISNKYGIMHVPTLIVFENGEIKNRASGVMSEDHLKEFINK